MKLHPAEVSQLFFAAANTKECVTCILAVISDAQCIVSMRRAAILRLRSVFQRHESLALLAQQEPKTLIALVKKLGTLLQAVVTEDSTLETELVSAIVAISFKFDSEGFTRQRSYKFCEAVMASAVQQIANGSLLDSRTITMMRLLATLLSQSVQSPELEVGQFSLSFQYAIAGHEESIFGNVLDMLTSGAAWTGRESSKAAIDILCALLSIRGSKKAGFLAEVIPKISLAYQSALGTSRQADLLTLTSTLLDAYTGDIDAQNRHGDPAVGSGTNSERPSSLQGSVCLRDLFAQLNRNGALTEALKIAIISQVANAKESSVAIIEKVCVDGSGIAEDLVQEGVVEYIFEGLHQKEGGEERLIPSDSVALYFRALLHIADQKPPSLGLKWECGLQSVFGQLATCSEDSVVELGISVLRRAFASAPRGSLRPDLVKQFLSFVVETGSHVGHEGSVLDMQLPRSLSGSDGFTRARRLFCSSISCLSELSLHYTFDTSMLGVVLEIAAVSLRTLGAGPETKSISRTVALQLAELEDVVVTNGETVMNVADGLLSLAFNGLGPSIATLFSKAAGDSLSHDAASETLGWLPLLVSASSDKVIKRSQTWKREEILAWFWRNIRPEAVFSCVESIEAHAHDDSENSRVYASRHKQIVKDYVYELLRDSITTSDKELTALTPATRKEFEAFLANYELRLEKNPSVLLLKRSLDTVCTDSFAWNVQTVSALRTRVVSLHEADTSQSQVERFEATCLLFQVAARSECGLDALSIPESASLAVVRHDEFCPASHPEAFLHAVTKARNAAATAAWIRYSLSSGAYPEKYHSLREHLAVELSSNMALAESLGKALLSEEVGHENFRALLHFWHSLKPSETLLGTALVKAKGCSVFYEALREYRVSTEPAASESVCSSTTSTGRLLAFRSSAERIAGLADVLREHINEIEQDELRRVTLLSCDVLQRMLIFKSRCNALVLQSILRFLIMLYERPYDESLETCRAYARRTPLLSALADVLKSRSRGCIWDDFREDDFVTATVACLLAVGSDSLSGKSASANMDKWMRELPQEPHAWAFLISTLTAPEFNDHAETCRAINCALLFLRLLRCPRQVLRDSVLTSPLLKSALLASASSQTVLLSDAAYSCLMLIENACLRLKKGKTSLATQVCLVRLLVEKLLHKRQSLRMKEVNYLAVSVRIGLVDVAREDIVNAIFSEGRDALLLECKDRVAIIEELRSACQEQRKKRRLSPWTEVTEIAPGGQKKDRSDGSVHEPRQFLFGNRAVVLSE